MDSRLEKLLSELTTEDNLDALINEIADSAKKIREDKIRARREAEAAEKRKQIRNEIISENRDNLILAAINYLQALEVIPEEDSESVAEDYDKALRSVTDLIEKYVKTIDKINIKVNGKNLNIAEKFIYFLTEYNRYLG